MYSLLLYLFVYEHKRTGVVSSKKKTKNFLFTRTSTIGHD